MIIERYEFNRISYLLCAESIQKCLEHFAIEGNYDVITSELSGFSLSARDGRIYVNERLISELDLSVEVHHIINSSFAICDSENLCRIIKQLQQYAFSKGRECHFEITKIF